MGTILDSYVWPLITHLAFAILSYFQRIHLKPQLQRKIRLLKAIKPYKGEVSIRPPLTLWSLGDNHELYPQTKLTMNYILKLSCLASATSNETNFRKNPRNAKARQITIFPSYDLSSMKRSKIQISNLLTNNSRKLKLINRTS